MSGEFEFAAQGAAAGVDRERGSLSLSELQDVFVTMRKDLVRFLSRRVGNPETAADLSHDMFEKILNVQAEIPTRQKAGSYFYRMAGNLAIDFRRVESRRAEILDGAQVLFEDAIPGPDEVAVSRDELRQIEEALAELPPKCREVLILSRVQGYSHREIAAQLDVSISLVEKYQLRALRHCRERLARAD